MTLGATAAQIKRLVLGQSLPMIVAGVVVGTIAALGAGRLLERSVDGVRALEPATVLAMLAVLVCAAMVATYIPARRASRLDAITALRQE